MNGASEVGIQDVLIRPQDVAKTTQALAAGHSITFVDTRLIFDVDSSLCAAIGWVVIG